MYRYLFKFVVMAISILTANLLTTTIAGYVLQWKKIGSPWISTLAGMGLVLIVLFPLFSWLTGWIDSLSKKIVKKGKSLGGKYLGLILTFIVCLGILFYFYLKMWTGIDLIHKLS